MNKYAKEMWQRAQDPLKTAEVDTEVSPDACASRAYYAAFYAVSALFALEEREFTKHTALRAAVHRDLVKTGRWQSAPVGIILFCISCAKPATTAELITLPAKGLPKLLERRGEFSNWPTMRIRRWTILGLGCRVDTFSRPG